MNKIERQSNPLVSSLSLSLVLFKSPFYSYLCHWNTVRIPFLMLLLLVFVMNEKTSEEKARISFKSIINLFLFEKNCILSIAKNTHTQLIHTHTDKSKKKKKVEA